MLARVVEVSALQPIVSSGNQPVTTTAPATVKSEGTSITSDAHGSAVDDSKLKSKGKDEDQLMQDEMRRAALDAMRRALEESSRLEDERQKLEEEIWYEERDRQERELRQRLEIEDSKRSAQRRFERRQRELAQKQA